MVHVKSDSDVTSVDPSSPRSSKRPIYYYQSPSRESNDGDKSSLMHATPVSDSPMESPSHPSYWRHSRTSSESRFSGPVRSFFETTLKGNGTKMNEKGWPECGVIKEEGNYDDLYEDEGLSRRLQVLIGIVVFLVTFSVFCLIIWGASRPYRAEITVKSFTLHNFNLGEGSDATGVPTKILTMNCSVRMTVYNPATFFGIHVSSNPVDAMYSELTVATGLMKKYYQPRKSHRTVVVNLQGNKVSLYGAGGGLSASDSNKKVPISLMLTIRSCGYVVGKLVRSTHHRHIYCSLAIEPHNNKPIKLKEDACTYD